MKLLDFLQPKTTVYEMTSGDMEGALEELVHSLVASGTVEASKEADVLDALLKREELGSTGIGMGVAIPHTKHDGIGTLVGVVGRSAQGVEFKALEQISSLIRHEHFCNFMKNAKTLEELNDILKEADEALFS